MEVTGQEMDVFICSGTLTNGILKAKPRTLDVKGSSKQPPVMAAADAPQKYVDAVSLKTLDIFAGAARSPLTSVFGALLSSVAVLHIGCCRHERMYSVRQGNASKECL
jgi:hypothetical protein